MDTWLNADPHNVVVLHNKVRAGLAGCVCEECVYLPVSLDCVSVQVCVYSPSWGQYILSGVAPTRNGVYQPVGPSGVVDNLLFLLFKIQPHLLPPPFLSESHSPSLQPLFFKASGWALGWEGRP